MRVDHVRADCVRVDKVSGLCDSGLHKNQLMV